MYAFGIHPSYEVFIQNLKMRHGEEQQLGEANLRVCGTGSTRSSSVLNV